MSHPPPIPQMNFSTSSMVLTNKSVTSLPTIKNLSSTKSKSTPILAPISTNKFPTINSVKLQTQNDIKYNIKPLHKEKNRKHVNKEYISPYSKRYLQNQKPTHNI